MKQKKILVLGHFGYQNDQLDGQTVKTRTIYESFKKSKMFKTDYFDVSESKKGRFYNLFIKLCRCDSVVFLPGINQLKILGPFLVIWKYLAFKEVHHIVVGGWLPTLIENNHFYRVLLRGFDSLSSELPSMTSRLAKYHKKSLTLTNFRPDSNCSSPTYFDGNKIKFIFFSRVIKEKGIFEAIKLNKKLIGEGYDVSLDIYGPMGLLDEDEIQFNGLLSDECQYYNSVSPEKVISTLSGHHILLFPSFYQGEGFPGCIVDSKISGSTVIASDWKYNREIVADGEDGIVVSEDYVSAAYKKIVSFYRNPDELNKLINASFASRSNYFSSHAFNEWQSRVFK